MKPGDKLLVIHVDDSDGRSSAATMVRLAKSGVRTTRIISLQEIIGAGSEGEDS